jgi:mitochondrial fission protein ELM1
MAGTSILWVLADERRGTAAQALGVAEALGVPYETKTIRHSALARLPNALLGASLTGVHSDSRAALAPPWPRLVIAAGRRAGAVARWIKTQSHGTTVLVQIMHPGGWAADAFDLIAAPRHDDLSGGNVLAVTGAPHGVTARVLAAAADAWQGRFAAFTRPTVALLLGGATRRRGFGVDEARALGAAVARLVAARRASLVVTSSPRTGEALDAVLAGALDAGVTPALVHRWGSGSDNPYLAFLALADALIVTGDSVTMLSEACAGTNPVYLYAPPGFATPKHARLHRELIAGGYVRPLGERIESWTHAPLNAASEVATEIRRRFAPVFAESPDMLSRTESAV